MEEVGRRLKKIAVATGCMLLQDAGFHTDYGSPGNPPPPPLRFSFLAPKFCSSPQIFLPPTDFL